MGGVAEKSPTAPETTLHYLTSRLKAFLDMTIKLI